MQQAVAGRATSVGVAPATFGNISASLAAALRSYEQCWYVLMSPAACMHVLADVHADMPCRLSFSSSAQNAVSTMEVAGFCLHNDDKRSSACSALKQAQFPFPFAQGSTFLLLLFVATAPVAIASFSLHAALAAVAAFLTVQAYVMVNEVARELEEPFRSGPNQLPLAAMQKQLNERLLAVAGTQYPGMVAPGGNSQPPAQVQLPGPAKRRTCLFGFASFFCSALWWRERPAPACCALCHNALLPESPAYHVDQSSHAGAHAGARLVSGALALARCAGGAHTPQQRLTGAAQSLGRAAAAPQLPARHSQAQRAPRVWRPGRRHLQRGRPAQR